MLDNEMSKQEMIESIIAKYKGIISDVKIQDFKSRLESQDDLSVLEVYVKNCLQ